VENGAAGVRQGGEGDYGRGRGLQRGGREGCLHYFSYGPEFRRLSHLKGQDILGEQDEKQGGKEE